MANSSDRTRWNDSSLDRLATFSVDGLRELTLSNNRNIDILVAIVSGHQERIVQVFEEIRDIRTETREIQSEIRILQLENRRMLEELRGRRNEEDEQP